MNGGHQTVANGYQFITTLFDLRCLPMFVRRIRSRLGWLPESLNGRIMVATITVVGISTVVRLGSLGKEVLVARYFGTSNKLDAFYVAFLLPTYLTGIIAAFACDAFIPTYIEVRSRQGDRAANILFSNIAALTIFILAALVVMLGTLQRWYLPVLA